MRRKPEWQRRIARERINILLSLAKKEVDKHPERSKRYVQLARKMAMKYNIRLKKRKREFCKNCNMPFIFSKTSKVRLNPKTKTVEIICLNCGKVYRYGYKS